MKLIQSKILAQLLFAPLLLIAQGQASIHQLDLEAHSDHSVCEVCMQISHLANGDFGVAELVALSSGIDFSLIPDYIPTVVNVYYTLRQPRAPPSFSLS